MAYLPKVTWKGCPTSQAWLK